jgi:hypothetical protein
MTTYNQGLDQARAQAESIAAMVAALTCDYDRLQELRDERADLASAAEDSESEDETAQAITALALWDDVARWDDENAEELNTLEHEAGDCTDEEDARNRIQEDPLSVEVRSGWTSLGDTMAPGNFRIVLCTGGPHVEIMGKLDIHGQPYHAWIQYQDWGTPMTPFFNVEQSTLLAYCQEFYFEF